MVWNKILIFLTEFYFFFVFVFLVFDDPLFKLSLRFKSLKMTLSFLEYFLNVTVICVVEKGRTILFRKTIILFWLISYYCYYCHYNLLVKIDK